ncbi:hypothetical protein DFH28DRAFT_1096485 [Melampsora americana]|nr:hypothetical protein DFH28DRAFT_1096485 [Melampsora americana]
MSIPILAQAFVDLELPEPKTKTRSKRTKSTNSVINETTDSQITSTQEVQPTESLQPDQSCLASTTQPQGSKGDFVSKYPSLTPENFERQLDKWTIADLRQEIIKQKSPFSHNRTRAPQEIRDLTSLIRIGYEKRILMAALMGGVPETVIWDLVNEGSKQGKPNKYTRFLAFCKDALAEKLPPRAEKEAWGERNRKIRDIWDNMTIDDKLIFEDPYFFSLANLPDHSKQVLHDNEDDEIEEDQSAQVSATQVHQLTEEEKSKYQPIFDRLVDIEKVHLIHGKPSTTSSIATLQLKSLAAFQKAHHSFAVECQRYHIHYYLTAASCDSINGWSEVASTNTKFAEWALETSKIPEKFKVYVHGLAAAKEIEQKIPQPTDARRGLLTRKLNDMLNKIHPGYVFPKVANPATKMIDKGWPIKIVQDEGSALEPTHLARGFRDCDDRMKKNWLSDIDNGLFKLEKIPEAEFLALRREANKIKKLNKSKPSNKRPANPSTSNQTSKAKKKRKKNAGDQDSSSNDDDTIEEDKEQSSDGEDGEDTPEDN